MNNNFLCQIIDTFEDFLKKKGYKIKDGELSDENAPYDLMEKLRTVCSEYGITVEDRWESLNRYGYNMKGKPFLTQAELEQALNEYAHETGKEYYGEMLNIALFLAQHSIELYESGEKEIFLPEALVPFTFEAFWVLQHNVDSYGCDWDWVYSEDGMSDILFCQKQYSDLDLIWLDDRDAFKEHDFTR